MEKSFDSIGRGYSEIIDFCSKRGLYMIGPARAGTTFARRAVGTHPKIIHIPYNSKLFTSLVRVRTANTTTFLKTLLRPQFFKFPPDFDYSIQALKNSQIAPELVEIILKIEEKRDFNLGFLLYPIAFISQNSKLASNLSQFDYWLIKDNSWIGLDYLLTPPVHLKAVIVVERDWRSIILSAAKVEKRGHDGSIDLTTLVNSASNNSVNFFEFFQIKRRDNPFRPIVMRYEDLVVNTGDALNHIFKQLDLQLMSADAIQSSLKDIEYKTTLRASLDFSNPVEARINTDVRKHNQSQTGIVSEGLQRWSRELGGRELEFIKIFKCWNSDMTYRDALVAVILILRVGRMSVVFSAKGIRLMLSFLLFRSICGRRVT